MAGSATQIEASSAAATLPAAEAHYCVAGRKRRSAATSAVCVVLVAYCCVAYWQARDHCGVPSADAAGPNAELVETRINPNTASWHELTILPRVGEVTAKKIVDYRTQWHSSNPDTPAFRIPEDLERIHGIGPKTVDRLRDRLKFDSARPP